MSANGQLSPSELAPIPGGRLRKDAAAAFNAMYAAARHRWGRLGSINIRDSYRPLGRPGDLDRGVWSQWAAWERYERGGNLAAHPGTSNHGWGTAIDLASSADRQRLDAIGGAYGWSKSWSDASSEWWHILYQPGHFVPAKLWTPNFRKGNAGPNILLMTDRLRKLGYLKRRWWRFNAEVDAAVRRFQKGHHFAADGIVGPVTWYAIKRLSKAKR